MLMYFLCFGTSHVYCGLCPVLAHDISRVCNFILSSECVYSVAEVDTCSDIPNVEF